MPCDALSLITPIQTQPASNLSLPLQVSKEHHRAGASSSEALEREDDKQLRLALQESLSYRSEHESNRSKEEELRSRREEEELNAALATSLLAAVPPVPGSFADEANQIREAQQLAYAASLSAKASSSRRASSSGDGEHNPSAVSAANPTGTPTAAPPAATIPATCDASPSGPPAAGEQPPLSNSAPAVAGGGRGGSESNAVRALEEEAIAAGVASAADTAAAARSRRLSGAPHPEYPPDYEDVRETEEVYAAQHHFVLTQLTRPSVAAFLDSGSDTEVEDEGDVELGRSMRTNSKFV